MSTEKQNGEVKIKKLKTKMEKWKIKRNHYVPHLGFGKNSCRGNYIIMN